MISFTFNSGADSEDCWGFMSDIWEGYCEDEDGFTATPQTEQYFAIVDNPVEQFVQNFPTSFFPVVELVVFLKILNS